MNGIKTILSQEQIKEAIVAYCKKKGFQVAQKDLSFRAVTDTAKSSALVSVADIECVADDVVMGKSE